ncbi:hypothetical protein SB748_26185 [Rhizobium sp. SIMBA_035]
MPDQFNESRDLMTTLIFTLGVITESNESARQQIAAAYSEARSLAASIPWDDKSARPRITACLARFNECKEAESVEAAAWMLTAIQERVAEKDLPDWETLKIVADKAAAMLPRPQRLR